MTDPMYLVDGDDRLQPLHAQAFVSEERLERLLATHADLLPGSQIDPRAPLRWLLVRRQAPIPDEDNGAGRWSLDLLYFDQHATPTLVEVKRSSDTRLRREVVGQLLDYAANGVAFWSLPQLIADFRATCAARDEDPDAVLDHFLSTATDTEDIDPDEFWAQAEKNLRAGQIRLIVLADRIPVELRRIVEFLNDQMDPAEVLAVEVQQFVGTDADGRTLRTLVPRLVGRTAQAEARKQTAAAPARWSATDLLEHFERRSPEERDAVRRLLDWAEANKVHVWYGRGKTYPSIALIVNHKDSAGRFRKHHFVAVSPNTGTVEVYFQYMKGPFALDAGRWTLFERLNEIDGIHLERDRIEKRPSFPVAALTEPTTFAAFAETATWFVNTVRAT